METTKGIKVLKIIDYKIFIYVIEHVWVKFWDKLLFLKVVNILQVETEWHLMKEH